MALNSTKQLIIDTAFFLFRKKSYDKVTVNEICRACRITKTTFYYHLKSKEEIASRFYESVIQDMASRMVDILAEENYWEQLIACFDTLINTTEKIGPDLLSQLFIINLRNDKGTFNLDENLTKLTVLLIERGQKAGQIRNQSPARSLYFAAAHMFEGFELLWAIKKGQYDRKDLIRRALEDIFDVAPALRSP